MLRDSIDERVTDQDFIRYPEAPLCMFELINRSLDFEERAPVLSEQALIKLLAAGREGLFEKEYEIEDLNLTSMKPDKIEFFKDEFEKILKNY